MQSLLCGVRRFVGIEEEPASVGGLRVAARDAQRAASVVASVRQRFRRMGGGALPAAAGCIPAPSRTTTSLLDSIPRRPNAARELHARPAGRPLCGAEMEALLSFLGDA